MTISHNRGATGSHIRKARLVHRPSLGIILLAVLVAATLLLRTWDLNRFPPGLWWDEATQGLDALDLLSGQFRVFFPRAQGKEPLYIYLTTPFVAAWKGEPFTTRLAGALLGALMVVALYVTARGLWRDNPRAGVWAGLAAGGLWAVNYWPQSINRIGFQVNAFPIVLTLAVATWLNWTYRPTRKRALTCGFLAGLTLATYLSARFTPVLWLVLFLSLTRENRRALRATLSWMLLAYFLTALPLAIHFLLRPDDFLSRAGAFPLLRGDLAPSELLATLWFNLRMVAGGFLAGAGDPVLRHNIPDRPAFSPLIAGLVVAGVVAAFVSLRRRSLQRGPTLLLWLAVMSVPSWLSLSSNPHFPRMFGALPAALLLAAWPLAELSTFLRSRKPSMQIPFALVLAILLVAEGARTTRDYFFTWRQMDLYASFQQDFTLLGRRIEKTPDSIAVVPMNTEAGDILDYEFHDASIHQIRLDEEDPESWLASTLNGVANRAVLLPIWNEGPHVFADPAGVLGFYLQREGKLQDKESFRAFDLLSFQLGEQPGFAATGIRQALNRAFPRNVELVEARWGAAFPNTDRSSATAAAGTPFWVILTWRLSNPSTNLRAAVDLVDSDGHRLGSSESPLLRLSSDTTPAEWPEDRLVNTYHLVQVPLTQPTGPVGLEARLYDAATLEALRPEGATAHGSVELGSVLVAEPVTAIEASDVQIARPLKATFDENLKMLGIDPWPETATPGHPLVLRFYWQAEQTPVLGSNTIHLILGTTGVSTTLQLPHDMPTDRPIHTYAELSLPAELASGVYDIVMSATKGEPSELVLGQIEIVNRNRFFEAPPMAMALDATFGEEVTLLGVDAPPQISVTPGQTVTFTLYWQAQGTPTKDLIRFVHLLTDVGVLQAQNDSRLCAGNCPAASWIKGEVFQDTISLRIPDDAQDVPLRLVVGWYDMATLTRLTALSETGERLRDDVLDLPLSVEVVPG